MVSRHTRRDQQAIAAAGKRSAERPDPALADMLELVEGLDLLVATAKKPSIYPGRVLINAEDYMALVDQLRRALPDELQQARRVVQERQQILLDAQAEAEKIISVAKERAEYLISEKGLTAEARVRGEDVLRKSNEDRRRHQSEIEMFALQIFEEAERAMRASLEEAERAVLKSLGTIEEAKGKLNVSQAR